VAMGNNSTTVHSRRLALDEKFELIMVRKASVLMDDEWWGRRRDATPTPTRLSLRRRVS